MQDQRFVLIVVQEPVLTVQLHFHITVDFIEAPILLVGKNQNSASADSSSSTAENKSFAAPESMNILSPAVRFPDNAPSEVSP